MKTLNVSAKKAKDTSKVYNVPFDVPESVEEAVKVWGAEVLLSNAVANAIVGFQSRIRAGMEKGLSNEDLNVQLKGAKPGVTTGLKIDAEQAIMARAKADPEYRKQLIEKLTAEAKARK
jgi:hypothetical protein